MKCCDRQMETIDRRPDTYEGQPAQRIHQRCATCGHENVWWEFPTPKHTAGERQRNIAPATRYPTIYAGRNTHVAQVVTRGLPAAEIEANADLVAAGPNMLAALKRLVACPDLNVAGLEPETVEALADAWAAIAKAQPQEVRP